MSAKILVFFLIVVSAYAAPLNNIIPAKTTISTRSTNSTNRIEHTEIPKPHHLFIGRCSPNDSVLHQENIILYNDGKSKISATIKVQVEAEVSITCVNIYDEIPQGEGAYATFLEGGVGQNFVTFNVDAKYGKGFHFFVQVFGLHLKENYQDGENLS